MSKGGARHTAKPEVDEGLLVSLFSEQRSLLQHMGSYERISRSQACNPKGLIDLLPTTKGLVKLEPTCEIHTQCLRKALFQVLLEHPALNNTQFSGAVWVGLKVERLGVLQYHMRRLANSSLQSCAARLTGGDLQQLQEVINMIVKKEQPALVERAEEPEPQPKKLKKEISDVSLDSSGLPRCFATPEQEKSQCLPLSKGGESNEEEREEGPLTKGGGIPSFLKQRPGQLAAKAAKEHEPMDLKKDLGIAKRPASKKKDKKPSTGGSLTKGSPKAKKGKVKKKKKQKAPADHAASTRKPWTKLRVTTPKKPPWRTYICGTTVPGGKGKLPLIVETTKVGHRLYLDIMAEIKRRLITEHLTKAEALDLRAHLYNTW